MSPFLRVFGRQYVPKSLIVKKKFRRILRCEKGLFYVHFFKGFWTSICIEKFDRIKKMSPLYSRCRGTACDRVRPRAWTGGWGEQRGIQILWRPDSTSVFRGDWRIFPTPFVQLFSTSISDEREENVDKISPHNMMRKGSFLCLLF